EVGEQRVNRGREIAGRVGEVTRAARVAYRGCLEGDLLGFAAQAGIGPLGDPRGQQGGAGGRGRFPALVAFADLGNHSRVCRAAEGNDGIGRAVGQLDVVITREGGRLLALYMAGTTAISTGNAIPQALLEGVDVGGLAHSSGIVEVAASAERPRLRSNVGATVAAVTAVQHAESEQNGQPFFLVQFHASVSVQSPRQ